MDIFEAVRNKDIERVRALLDEGVSVDSKNKNGIPILYRAVHNSRESTEIVKLLIDRGANVNIKLDQGGHTPLMTAAENTNVDSSLDTVKLLLASGADINARSNTGMSALSYAVANSNQKSSLETVKLLLDSGADIEIRNNIGSTPLIVATVNSDTKSSLDTIKLLIDYGADLFVKRGNQDIVDICPTTDCKELVNYHIWKKLYSRDVETAFKYSKDGAFPKDVWEIILLNRRQQLLCKNLSSDKNKGVLMWFAMELNIPIVEEMTKAQLCGLISKQIVYGKIYHNTESDMNRIKKQLIQIAKGFGIDTNRSIEEITRDISKVLI